MTNHPFDLLIELNTRYIRLDCAALHLARDVYPDLVLTSYLDRLDEIADSVAELRPGLSAPLRYEAMRQVIVDEYGLRGNENDYYDPENSYLNRVLDRRGLEPLVPLTREAWQARQDGEAGSATLAATASQLLLLGL